MPEDRNNAPEPVVIVIIDESSTQEFVLKPEERVVIGRYEPSSRPARSESGVELAPSRTRQYRSRSPDVSEEHAEVRVTKEGRVVVKDLASTNGTLARLPPYHDFELLPNTEVRCGASLFLQRRSPLWESMDDHGRFERAEDFAAYIQARLKEFGAEAQIISADGSDCRRLRGLYTRLPLPHHQSYIVVTWKRATFNLALERWLQLHVLLFNSGSLCVPLGNADRIDWKFTHGSADRLRVLKAARKVAATDGTVLLFGSTGIGKDVLARDLHDHSARANGPFLAFNCANLPLTLADSELFGTERGAFTQAQPRPGLFEQAHGGTLFLDEIAELPLELQAKLLRVLEDRRIRRLGSTVDRPIDVRLIAATHRNLPEMVKDRQFRADLWFRLEGVQLHIPELQADDIRALTYPLYKDVSREENAEPLPDEEIDQIALLASRREWPGNARQLRSALRRYLLYRDPSLTVEENWHTAMSMNQSATGGQSDPAVAPVASGDGEESPKGIMSAVENIERLLALTVARPLLGKYRWGAWAELGRRLDLTGAGAQDKIKRLGFSTDPPPDAAQIDQAIEDARSALAPYLGFLKKTLRL